MKSTNAILSLIMVVTARSADRPSFQTLRYNEVWASLADPTQRTDLFDPLKFVPVQGTNIYLSIGAEARIKYERYDQPVFSHKPADNDGFLLQRYLVSADLHAAPHFRTFVQLQSSIETSRNGGPRPTDRDDLDLHQAFVDAKAPLSSSDQVTIRVGRQEMAYGSQRLISVRESPNNRLAFDAVRLLGRFGQWSADVWLGQPVATATGFFDDRPMTESTFWGAYASGPITPIPNLTADLYYLGLSRANATFARGAGDELRHSLGTRLFGRRGPLDWNIECVGQFGSFGNHDIYAWTAASETGWAFSAVPTRPRAFLRADIVSGDHGGSTLSTFNPFFPRGSYFNEASLIGPQNLVDVQPGVDFALTKALKLTPSCDFVWRESLNDGVYGVAGNLQVAPGASRAKYVGAFPSATLIWQANRHLNLTFYYVAYLFGDFVNQSQPNQRNGHYVSTAITFRF